MLLPVTVILLETASLYLLLYIWTQHHFLLLILPVTELLLDTVSLSVSDVASHSTYYFWSYHHFLLVRLPVTVLLLDTASLPASDIASHSITSHHFLYSDIASHSITFGDTIASYSNTLFSASLPIPVILPVTVLLYLLKHFRPQ